MQTPLRPGTTGYKSYTERLLRLKLLELVDRRKIACTAFAIRVLQSPWMTELKSTLNCSMCDTTVGRRNTDIFNNIRRYSTQNTPLRNLLSTANEFSQMIDIYDDVHTSKRRMKEYFADVYANELQNELRQ